MHSLCFHAMWLQSLHIKSLERFFDTYQLAQIQVSLHIWTGWSVSTLVVNALRLVYRQQWLFMKGTDWRCLTKAVIMSALCVWFDEKIWKNILQISMLFLHIWRYVINKYPFYMYFHQELCNQAKQAVFPWCSKHFTVQKTCRHTKFWCNLCFVCTCLSLCVSVSLCLSVCLVDDA